MKVTTIIITAGECNDWESRIARFPSPAVIVRHDFGGGVGYSYGISAEHSVVDVDGAFSWPILANLGTLRLPEDTDWICFSHDDVDLRDHGDIERLCLLGHVLDSPLVFPSIDGPDGAPMQRKLVTGAWSDATEYCSGALFVVKREFFDSVGGFPSFMPGKGLFAAWLQRKLLHDRGKHAIVSHRVMVGHEYGGTYGKKLAVEQQRAMIGEAQRYLAGAFGIPMDRMSRIAEPGLVHRAQGVAQVAWDHGSLISTLEGCRQQVRSIDACDRPGLLEAAAALSQSDDFEFEDNLYRRFAIGDRYVVPEILHVLHFGLHAMFGLGDIFFFMKVFATMKKAWPWITIHVWGISHTACLLERCQDVDHFHKERIEMAPTSVMDMYRFGALGGSETARAILRYFGLEYDRLMPRFVLPFDWVKRAEEKLKAGGWNGKDRLICVQRHGGWKAKRWAGTERLVQGIVDVASYAGKPHRYAVWTFGEPLPETIDAQLSLEEMIGAMRLANVVVGFDSGPVHAAAALGTPVIALFGPHGPDGLLTDADVRNVVVIRNRDPFKDCGAVHCRAGGRIGEHCPLRGDAAGADCIDETSPAAVMAQLLSLDLACNPVE